MKNSFYLIIVSLVILCCNDDENEVEKNYNWPSDIDWITYDSINSGLHNDFIVSVEIDKEGNKWIGTFADGIAKFNGTDWVTYDTENSPLPNDSITTLTFDNHNNLWIGTSNGLAKFDGSNWTVWNTDNSDLPINLITAVAIDKNNIIWIGCGHCCAGGLMKYDRANWTLYTPENSILPCRIINDIFVDRDNNIWIATWRYQGNGGVVKVSGEDWTLYNSDNSKIPYNVADDITQDSDGNIWIGVTANSYDLYDEYDGCLLKFDWNNWTVFKPHDQISKLSNRVQCVKIDNRDNIWIALSPEPGPPYEEYEIAMFNGRKWIAISDIDSNVYNAYVKDMEFDSQNDLWIGQAAYGLTKMEIDYE